MKTNFLEPQTVSFLTKIGKQDAVKHTLSNVYKIVDEGNFRYFYDKSHFFVILGVELSILKDFKIVTEES